MTQPARRFAIKTLINGVDARPRCFLVREPAQAQSAGDQTHCFAHRVDVDLVRGQLVIAAEFATNSRRELRIRNFRPTERRHEARKQAGMLEGFEHCADIRVSRRMGEDDHRRIKRRLSSGVLSWRATNFSR